MSESKGCPLPLHKFLGVSTKANSQLLISYILTSHPQLPTNNLPIFSPHSSKMARIHTTGFLALGDARAATHRPPMYAVAFVAGAAFARMRIDVACLGCVRACEEQDESQEQNTRNGGGGEEASHLANEQEKAAGFRLQVGMTGLQAEYALLYRNK